MICPDCKSQLHEKCKGGTYCACQHRKDARILSERERRELANAHRDDVIEGSGTPLLPWEAE